MVTFLIYIFEIFHEKISSLPFGLPIFYLFLFYSLGNKKKDNTETMKPLKGFLLYLEENCQKVSPDENMSGK